MKLPPRNFTAIPAATEGNLTPLKSGHPGPPPALHWSGHVSHSSVCGSHLWRAGVLRVRVSLCTDVCGKQVQEAFGINTLSEYFRDTWMAWHCHHLGTRVPQISPPVCSLAGSSVKHQLEFKSRMKSKKPFILFSTVWPRASWWVSLAVPFFTCERPGVDRKMAQLFSGLTNHVKAGLPQRKRENPWTWQKCPQAADLAVAQLVVDMCAPRVFPGDDPSYPDFLS